MMTMSHIALTRFPNLHASISSPSVLNERVTKSISRFGFPEDVVLRSWAALLRGYTGHETVSFVADDACVSIDTTCDNVQRDVLATGTQDETRGETEDATGVFFQGVCDICVACDNEN